MSLSHICEKVSEIIGVQIKFVEDCIGTTVETAVSELQNGEVLLLENLRFYGEEEKGDEAFAQALSKNGDIYVNDAFGTAHRAHASTTIVANYFSENKCFGYLLAREIKAIDKVMQNRGKTGDCYIGRRKGFIKNHHYRKYLGQSRPSDHRWRDDLYLYKGTRRTGWGFHL